MPKTEDVCRIPTLATAEPLHVVVGLGFVVDLEHPHDFVDSLRHLFDDLHQRLDLGHDVFGLNAQWGTLVSSKSSLFSMRSMRRSVSLCRRSVSP